MNSDRGGDGTADAPSSRDLNPGNDGGDATVGIDDSGSATAMVFQTTV